VVFAEKCHLCGGPLSSLPTVALSRQVTSDCRAWPSAPILAVCQSCDTVQKLITPAWHTDIRQIYADYAMYGQAGGAEQISFDLGAGAGMARSARIATWLAGWGLLPKQGGLLDIGCGNGAFLKAFGVSQPGWTMTGCELDERNKLAIEAIPGVDRLHVGPMAALGRQFDLVVLVHALEHVVDPVSFLASVMPLMRPGAHLLIQVPDLMNSPFDLLIADHCSHFSAVTLSNAVTRAGFVVEHLVDQCVDKELTLVCRQAAKSDADNCDRVANSVGAAAAQAHLAWLADLASQAQATEGQVAIFGSSIAATWLASLVGQRLQCFVDEDPSRSGRSHMGRPIVDPDQSPANVPVLVPLRPDVARSVIGRLSVLDRRFIEPPALQ
jgi:SAM-dependent methyltransferase